MKKHYESINDFKNDLNREYSFRDICILNSWLSEEEFSGQMVCCKFHQEKTPSMQVGDHFFRCYGCGAKGDIFTFAEKLNNYSFFEALNDITASVGCTVAVKGYNRDEIERKKAFLRKQWEDFKTAYAKECKTNKEVLSEGQRYFPFDVGYDSKENRIVLAYMKNDTPLGFTMRRISKDDKDGPKWKHSYAETTLTHLVSQIFNIDSLKKMKEAIVVEGPGDVASVVRAGYENAICCCGTSNISEKVLTRICAEGIESLIMFPDGDSAGDKAKIRWTAELAKFDYWMAQRSFIVCAPTDRDPGELDKETIVGVMKYKVPCLDYFFENITEDFIIEILKDKEFRGNPILRKIVEVFADRNELTFEEAKRVLSNKIRFAQKDEGEENEYLCRLKATAGIDDYGLRYERIEGMTPDRALKIIKLKFKGG